MAKRPTFLICGIQKGGTTALHAYLASHPDVFCPARKELNFFDANWERGLGWYEAHFAGACGALAVGEASPHYMRFDSAAQRIAATLPEARLIFILRDPVRRAWSNYDFNLARGQQAPGETLLDALSTERGWARYAEKGFYARDLVRYEALVGRERMLVLFAENLRKEPRETLRRAFAFIGVDPERWSPRPHETNTTALPRTQLARHAIYRWGQVRKRLEPAVPGRLARATRGVRDSMARLLSSGARRTELDEATRSRLAAIYADANQELADWLAGGEERAGQALPAWLPAARAGAERVA